ADLHPRAGRLGPLGLPGAGLHGLDHRACAEGAIRPRERPGPDRARDRAVDRAGAGRALVVSIGLQGVIIIDLVTFLFAVGALMFIRIPRPEQSAEGAAASGTLLHEAAQGWHYIRARAGLLGILISFAAFNFLANIAAVTMAPLVLSFARADVLGLVQSAGGAGMLI